FTNSVTSSGRSATALPSKAATTSAAAIASSQSSTISSAAATASSASLNTDVSSASSRFQTQSKALSFSNGDTPQAPIVSSSFPSHGSSLVPTRSQARPAPGIITANSSKYTK